MIIRRTCKKGLRKTDIKMKKVIQDTKRKIETVLFVLFCGALCVVVRLGLYLPTFYFRLMIYLRNDFITTVGFIVNNFADSKVLFIVRA